MIIKESVLNQCDYEEEGIEFIECTEWKDDGKYSFKYYIFKFQNFKEKQIYF